jgi:hypothetical protein
LLPADERFSANDASMAAFSLAAAFTAFSLCMLEAWLILDIVSR